MRALLIANRYPPAGAGGYERIAAATAAALRGAGHDVRILTTRDTDGDTPSDDVRRTLRWYAEADGFATPTWRARLRTERANAAALADALDGVDVVCWWGMGGMSLSLIEQVRRAGVPAVGVVGDGWMAYGPEADAWTRGWARAPRPLAALGARLSGVPTRLRLSDGARWLCISEAVRARAVAEHDLARTALAHPGVDPRTFPFRPPAEDWGGRLAIVGRVEPRKGVAVAVEAVGLLTSDVRLVVDGPAEGDHAAELAALAARLGVAERVAFTRSPADRVADAYAGADAVLFPVTWPEPWGLVPLEAMSVGRPVIATGTGGSAEYLRDGENALVVAPGDARALAAAVTRLADDPELRDRLVAGGRATAARFTAAAFEAAVVGAAETAAVNR